jgi:hypothetical protein
VARPCDLAGNYFYDTQMRIPHFYDTQIMWLPRGAVAGGTERDGDRVGDASLSPHFAQTQRERTKRFVLAVVFYLRPFGND